MLVAYYSRGCDSKELFQAYEIAQESSFLEKINQYNVLFLNMQEFASQSNSMGEMLQLVKKSVLWDLFEEYPDFLRDLLKDKAYTALGYMTGILPIKKYGTHSAL